MGFRCLHNLLMTNCEIFFCGRHAAGRKAYANTGSMKEAFFVQEDICETLKMDFSNIAAG